MTPEHRTRLQELIDEVETKYVEFVSPDTPFYRISHFKSIETEIFNYIDSLLAAKDAEIAALKAPKHADWKRWEDEYGQHG